MCVELVIVVVKATLDKLIFNMYHFTPFKHTSPPHTHIPTLTHPHSSSSPFTRRYWTALNDVWSCGARMPARRTSVATS